VVVTSAEDRADALRAAVATYASAYDDVVRSTEAYCRLVTDLLDDAGINYLSVTGRPKSVASFAAKAHREAAGRPVFLDPLTEITDVVGVRVITYLRRDVAAVADLLRDELVVLDDRDMGRETASEGRFGYASRHLLVEREGDRAAQVQVRTVLQHAWAEFEHAIRYKGTVPEEHASDLDRRFTLAAGLLELADQEFTTISERLAATVSDRPAPDADDPRIRAEDLATFLGEQYTDAGWSRPDHYAWVSGLLLELGITSLDELSGLLTSVDSEAIHERMGSKYPAGAVRRLDDALLAVFGERYVDLHGNRHRVPLLQARLEKLTSPPD
jgi:putative GTP pyrophosphokinase